MVLLYFQAVSELPRKFCFLLGVLLNPANDEMPFPFVLTGPAESAAYFEQIDAFIGLTLGEEAQAKYQIIINDPEQVAQTMKSGVVQVKNYRKEHKDAFYFNWLLQIQPEFQQPFNPSHENMAALHLHRDQPKHLLAANLRRAFSGIVAGNVKPETIISVSAERAVPDQWRKGNHAGTGSLACVVCRATAHEAAGCDLLQPLLQDSLVRKLFSCSPVAAIAASCL